MKERPILFNAPMVRALLDDSKAQTRRVARHPALQGLSHIVDCGAGWWGDEEGDVQVCCPYGKPGDRLWVREKFRGCRAYEVQGYPPKDWGNKPIWFEADGPAPGNTNAWAIRARPSIYMPRWASRITLEVTGVRVQRLQEISESNASSEGLKFNSNHLGPWSFEGGQDWLSAREAYRELWRQIHGPDSWEANPWVWVVEFKRWTS